MKQAVNTEKIASTLPGLMMLPVLLLAGAAFVRFGIVRLQGGATDQANFPIQVTDDASSGAQVLAEQPSIFTRRRVVGP